MKINILYQFSRVLEKWLWFYRKKCFEGYIGRKSDGLSIIGKIYLRNRNVYIGKGSVIENCVILQNTVIGNNVTMSNTITDKGILIDDNEEVKGLENNPVIIPKKRVV